jgi:tRNA-(ms[2]io[6]A)-hydroxylase
MSAAASRRDELPADPLTGLPLLQATAPEWIAVAAADLDALLIDHAHCELKAAANAMAMAGRYAEHTALVRDLTALAREELRHFDQVHDLVRERGHALTRPGPDHYVKELEERTRQGGSAAAALRDQLLRCGFIEARSCERFRLLAGAALPARLGEFYADLALAEARHHVLFFDHAGRAAGGTDLGARIAAMATIEADIVRALPLAARIH